MQLIMMINVMRQVLLGVLQFDLVDAYRHASHMQDSDNTA